MNLKWNKEMQIAFQKILEIDQSFKNIFNQIGFPTNRATKQGFESLARIIISQQISTNAAKTICSKIIKDNLLNEKEVAKANIETLKLYGLSSQKAFYLKNLATLINNNELDIKSLSKVSSEDVTNILIKIKGIGKWTINNYKIFALQDVNAWPSADLALQESVKIIKNLKKRPNEIEMEKIGEVWLPYRGAASLLLWHFYNKVKIEKKYIKI